MKLRADGRCAGQFVDAILTPVRTAEMMALPPPLLLLLLLAVPTHELAAGTRSSPPPSAAELQAQLDAAIGSRAASFTVPPGEYNFSTRSFNVTAASNLRLQAEGARLQFGYQPHLPVAGVNFSNCNSVHVSGLEISCAHSTPHHTARPRRRLFDVAAPGCPPVADTGLPRTRSGLPGITYNLLNCSDITSEDITIHQAPFFSVTAFNGDGGHIFRRFHLPNDTTVDPETGRPTDPYPHQRDAFHFTDLRRGVLLEDSHASGFGDDFFNSHNTIMLVLRRESPTSLLLINPHLQNVIKAKGPHSIIENRNTVYGTNCVLENLRAGDQVHFFGCPQCLSSNGPGKNANCSASDFIPPPLGGIEASVVAGAPEQVTDAAVVADASDLAAKLTAEYSFTQFDASDIWRVHFSAPLPAAVERAALVNIDSFSTPGTVIRNNNFSFTKYNLGRFKSSGGQILNNHFSHAGSANLEISALLQYFEGPLPIVRDVVVSGNTIVGEGADPIHCSTMCGRDLPGLNGTALCPDCEHSAFATNISVNGNEIVP